MFSVLALSAAATPAMAASTSQEGYTTPAGVVQSDVAGTNNTGTNGNNSANTTRSTSGSQLPFTGLDVGLIAGAGALLVLLGVGMSRLTRTATRVE
jgi:hypothetical protein